MNYSLVMENLFGDFCCLQDAYAELVKLAVERRARLDESRKLWQFYWDMADEENWIKEKEQIVTNGDIGHDLTTINLLLSKHKVDQSA
jgi:spectrin beta